MPSRLVRWSFSGCLLFPPAAARTRVLVVVLAFVLVLLFRGYDLPTTLALLGSAGLMTAQVSQHLMRPRLAPATLPPSVS
ncbi:hypothetical protein [Amycolatopsis sp. NPDC003861]